MTFKKPDKEYWNRKLAAYMHDPLDRVLTMQGHEERVAVFLEKYGLTAPNEAFWKKADLIAAGFERGPLPSYSTDAKKNGAVDFIRRPIITHPTSEESKLDIKLPDFDSFDGDNFFREFIDFISKDENVYSDKFKNNESDFAIARFLYNHLVLRFRLAHENVCGLGAFWHRVPADSRFPDHSIWQHKALCSALHSSIELADGNADNIGIMVFSITPVQAFIAKARKLRDSWTASVLLSWLAFEGIKWIMENLGPDHVIYPSLIDQPLVNEYLVKYWAVSDDCFLNPPKDIASFPNKFLFLVPMNLAETIAEAITSHIFLSWKDLYEKVCEKTIFLSGDFLSDDKMKAHLRGMFERQNANFWDFQWAASYLVKHEDKKEIESLLPESTYGYPFKFIDLFKKMIEDKEDYDRSGIGSLYSVSHTLAQSALAASKNKKHAKRNPENGEKCHLCGEFEILHHIEHNGGRASEYSSNARAFWNNLIKRWDGEGKNDIGFNLKENEKLCSICLVKRMISETIRDNKSHILYSVLKDSAFPSTTEIALRSYFEREQIEETTRKKKAQEVHENADDKTDNRDRYYAILLMDGDRMGKLVNGETLGSTWESVIHPQIVERLKNPQFDSKYREAWQGLFTSRSKRLVTPAIHAAISESLGDFSLYGVHRIVEKHMGRLIYAGGDDVCAVLPVESAVQAADEIQKYYRSGFRLVKREGIPEEINGAFLPSTGKLSINLGKGEGISISGGILICHHKESLSKMIAEAQHLLKYKAKDEGGRNACAIQLRKRSGGSRFFIRSWSDEQAWKSFSEIGASISSEDKLRISNSLVHRLEKLRPGVQSILNHNSPEKKIMFQKIVAMQLDKSSVGKQSDKEVLAEKIANIVIYEDQDGNMEYKPEGLIVAAFLSQRGENNGMV